MAKIAPLAKALSNIGGMFLKYGQEQRANEEWSRRYQQQKQMTPEEREMWELDKKIKEKKLSLMGRYSGGRRSKALNLSPEVRKLLLKNLTGYTQDYFNIPEGLDASTVQNPEQFMSTVLAANPRIAINTKNPEALRDKIELIRNGLENQIIGEDSRWYNPWSWGDEATLDVKKIPKQVPYGKRKPKYKIRDINAAIKAVGKNPQLLLDLINSKPGPVSTDDEDITDLD